MMSRRFLPLVLSGFAGASRELTEALVATVPTSTAWPTRSSRRWRWRRPSNATGCETMRAVVSAHNVYGWAGTMLIDAARSQRNLLRITISV